MVVVGLENVGKRTPSNKTTSMMAICENYSAMIVRSISIEVTVKV